MSFPIVFQGFSAPQRVRSNVDADLVYTGVDPRFAGLSIECSDSIWTFYALREKNGVVIADELSDAQIVMLLNRMRAEQVLP